MFVCVRKSVICVCMRKSQLQLHDCVSVCKHACMNVHVHAPYIHNREWTFYAAHVSVSSGAVVH